MVLNPAHMEAYFSSALPQMKKDLQRLCRIASVRSEAAPGAPFGKGPKEALEEALKICREKGLKTLLVADAAGEAEFESDKPVGLGILAHMDVVPAGPGWSVEPFELTEQGDYYLGRGVIDDKGPFVAALYALLYLKESGAVFKENVRLIVGSDEECGSGDMALYAKERQFPEKVFTPDGDFPLINIEKGRCCPTFAKTFETPIEKGVVSIRGGEITNAVPGLSYADVKGIPLSLIAEAAKDGKGGCTFGLEEEGDLVHITSFGKNAHASTPFSGINALKGLWSLLVSLPLEKEQKESLEQLLALFPVGDDLGENASLAARDEESGPLTSVFSVFDWNEKGYEGRVDIRFPLCCNLALLKEKLAVAAEKMGASLACVTGAEPHAVESDSPFVKTLISAYEQETGENGCKPLAIGGGTYVHEIEGGVAFGAEFPGDDNHMHGADERLHIGNFVKTAKIFARAIAALCCE
ncbi:MAG: Sapep family Mn(2+)-dependent dipeptidase [Oscillospiraceae bacterium]|nr:Sapep family Mn(2+)-dependent dipeptidase [Oscillospiraceae bacterium]